MSQEVAYTLFILGAGANVPYGFPTGEGLKQQICHEFENYYKEIIPHSTETEEEYYDYDQRIEYYKNEFRKHFCQSPTPSIDLFLSRNPEFQYIGKVGILLCLIESEKKSLENGIVLEEPDWLEYLFNKMTETFIEPDHYNYINNRVRFITFNYDRLLESFLVQSIKYSFKKSYTHIDELIKKIPIEHVYGKIGLLPWENTTPTNANVLPFGHNCHFEQINHLITNLKLIQDRKVMENNHLEEMVRNARRIFFLGFSYAPENLEILGIPKILNDSQKIYGTALHKYPDEIAYIESRLSNDVARTKKRNIIEDCDCLTLLRKYLQNV